VGTTAVAAGAAAPRYSGPAVASALDAPYTVFILWETDSAIGQCTGTILDERRVLTAAHCTFGPDGQPLGPANLVLVAGTAQLVSDEPPPEVQFAEVAGIRRHPASAGDEVTPFADVAVLELATPWTLTAAVSPIPLTPVGASISPGAIVRGFGWGGSGPDGIDGHMHTLDMTVGAADDCEPGRVGVACASSPAGGICSGDSGGPIVATDGSGRLLGVASTGAGECTAGTIAGFVDLAAPGIGLWVRGDDAPPAMPETTASPALSAPPLRGGSATCAAPPWTGADVTTTVFAHADTGTVVQDGASTTYVPQRSDVGHELTCRSVAASAGGTASIRAESAVSIVAAELRVVVGRRHLAISYTGAPRLPLRVTASRRSGRPVWSRNARAARRVRLPQLRPGRYRLCVEAPAAGQFAATEACQRWRVRRKR
jgi:hypothetical protein